MKAVIILFLCCPFCLFSQKKSLQIADVQRWRKIDQPQITSDGQWVAYLLTPTTEGDNVLCLWNARTNQTVTFARGAEPKFSDDGNYLVFKIRQPLDTLKAQRRRKVKDEDLPKDSLGVYTLASGTLAKFPNVKSFALPDKWAGWLAFQLEPEKEKTAAKKDSSAVQTEASPDSTKSAAKEKKEPKPKKEDAKENGSRLVLHHLPSGREDTVPFVREYLFAKRGPVLLLYSTGRDSAFLAGAYRYDCTQNRLQPLFCADKVKCAQLAADDWGRQAAFLIDTDTSKARIRPWRLGYWSEKQDSTRLLADTASAFLPRLDPPDSSYETQKWGLSDNARPMFSEDGSKLYFGIAPPPLLPDTTRLPEEIVNVEVWAWDNNRLYTELEKRLEADKKRSYPVVYHIGTGNFVPLGTPDLPEWRFQEQRDANLALAYSEEPYARYVQWEGVAHRDLYAVDLKTGNKKQIGKDLRCKPSLSPAANFIFWWSDPDSAWYAWSAKKNQTLRLTDNRSVPFFNEENDVPDYPDEYGLAGWLTGDVALLLYDRFDIWKVDPEGKTAPQRLTHGRETHTRYRYIRLDPEERSIAPAARLLLHEFSETTKAEGYAWLDLKTGQLSPWMGGVFSYTRNPLKAGKAGALVFNRQNYHTFPDLWYTPLPDSSSHNSSPETRISDANPQQAEYHWGNIERVHWVALNGDTLEGLLVKPDDFDPAKQYPMLVNFYEKLSDGLHVHRAPDVHRSTINYTMYASRGYLVFAPDIRYRTGYPGESAYDAIMSGVTALIQRGFVDPKRIALQGHSWGGYQIAYLVTRTNLFACAEAGAAVVNMTSAYGGIRWESGINRQFQYERQQSRIGGSLWEYPMRYLENSPLFSLDKVQTPLLILHNDKDSAVPWEQGVEFFTGLRRLGKPAWMLNYNDEPHWPVKLQNRIDFQTRMQQFFDHFLLAAPMPRWMERGVPPIEKGILQGLDK